MNSLPRFLSALAVLIIATACGALGAASPTPDSTTVTVRIQLLPTAQPTPASTPTPTPLPPSKPLEDPVQVPILMYHHISPTVPANPMQARLTVSVVDFRQQLDYLRREGYTSITLAQLFDALDGRAPLPSKPVILTFDDGYADAFAQVFPLLKEYGFKGTFAIATGLVGGFEYVNWEQIRTMAADGMEFASHTVNHADLKAAFDYVLRDELWNSKRALEEQLGRKVEFFVYPSGEPFRTGSKAQQQTVISILQESGYRGALLAGPSSTKQDPRRPYELNRVRVSGGASLQTFVALLQS